MNPLNSILVLAGAFLAVFGEAAFSALRQLLGAQVDLLPTLMVFAALNTDIVTVVLLAVLGGLCFDALSANPFGITILSLFAVGFAIFLQRELILRKSPFAQFILGAVASRRTHADGFAIADRRKRTTTWMGFALAVARDDSGRRGGGADNFRIVRLVQSRVRLSAANRNEFPPRP